MKNVDLNTATIQTLLTDWFKENQRQLPWRTHRDPYSIWISEIMLQQTTVQAVIPYFIKFKKAFPSVNDLATAPLEDVLQYWAGLGYYSRARNLHKAAQLIAQLPTFPKLHKELLNLPGFGDYTSRAVSSIAFEEPVGVVDGNVIRILSRLTGIPFVWWNREDKNRIQSIADKLVQGASASIVNQAMMELGATVCTPTSPGCALCPWLRHCQAQKAKKISDLPIKRPKKSKQIIHLTFEVPTYKNKIALVENTTLPFLKGTLLPPVKWAELKSKPKRFQFTHSITHYQIFVSVQEKPLTSAQLGYSWHLPKDLKKVNPSSLLQKTVMQISNI